MQVYENECKTEKDQSCTTVYDTTFQDKCHTEYVRWAVTEPDVST